MKAPPPVGGRMRLVSHLLVSHGAPIILVMCALGLTLAALVRMTSMLDALGHDEMQALRREGDLHRAAWSLDVAIRHAEDDCAAGRPGPVPERIEAHARDLELRVAAGDSAAEPMHALVAGYLTLARELIAAPELCLALGPGGAHTRRAALDERLTDLWVMRLDELHARVTEKEEEARRIGASAAWGGTVLAVASLILAGFVARLVARTVSEPLAGLAGVARRVGRADFSTPVSASDGPVEVAELADELERMRMRLAELDGVKQGILTSVSHELRTPLSQIRQALALLADGVVGPLEARQSQIVGIARHACEREIRMVTNVLDLSRLRAGSSVCLLESAAIDDVLERALAAETAAAAKRSIVIELEAAGPSPVGYIDFVMVERAVANLVRNAVAVSRRGQRVLVRRVVTHRRDLPADIEHSLPDAIARAHKWVVIAVKDKGPGVPDAIRATVFEPFVTRAVPGSSKGVGVGLGLSLAREIARAHGGDLELRPDEDRGATFRLWLPLLEQPPSRVSA